MSFVVNFSFLSTRNGMNLHRQKILMEDRVSRMHEEIIFAEALNRQPRIPNVGSSRRVDIFAVSEAGV
jgi:hypothetical protein